MFRKKKVLVRILDSPMKMIIEPKFILVPLPDGKVLILHGHFEHIRDADAFDLAYKAVTKIAA